MEKNALHDQDGKDFINIPGECPIHGGGSLSGELAQIRRNPGSVRIATAAL